MTNRLRLQASASSHLRVSVACFRWNGESIETITTEDLALPSTLPAAHESLDETAYRIVSTSFAIPAAYMEQLYTFDNVDNVERETNVTYIALFPPDADSQFVWTTPAGLPALPGLTATMVDYAFVRLRAKLEYTNIAFHLLPPQFTLASLQLVYESILGLPLDKRNFRRRMTTSGMLEPTGDKLREGPHRPAALYRFSGQTDRSSYLTPPSSTSPGWQESVK
jgi:8-oxo-dGTP diphosphatase